VIPVIVTTPDTSVCELADTRLSAYVAAIRALPWDEIAAPPFNGSRADEDRDHPGLAAAGRKHGDPRSSFDGTIGSGPRTAVPVRFLSHYM
jgi:hypothetical protein